MPDVSAMDTTDEERGSATVGSGDPAAGGHVRALDGMRAVAVLLVLLFHLRFPGFSSGFLGVDIFFVLSGFLITTLLLTELDRTGRVSLPEFWARRARRLLPALVVLLLVVAGVTWLQGTFTERASVRGDLLATTGYVANWHFINTSSYFADIGVDSPLEHTWSLAIEEQFYLLWPLVVFGVALLWKRRPRLGVGTVAVVGSVISAGLLWLLWSPGSVERAYMGTDARIFEPLVGAAGAVLVATPSIRRWLNRWGGVVLGFGVLALVSAILLIDASPSSYYVGGALLVALATLSIVGPLWLGHGGVLSDVLGWSPIAWIGVVSYGAYLWHWPLTVWLGARQDAGGGLLVRRLGVIALTFGIAALSYHAIEHPIRRGGFGLRAKQVPRSRRARQRRVTLIAIPVSLLTVACISVAATRVPDIPASVPSMMMVGDSVPLQLTVAMDRALTERGWRLASATFGACAVTGETLARPDGRPIDKVDVCTEQIARDQDRLVRETDPDVVLWWDRWSLANFFTADGAFVRSGTARFWDLRREGLRRAVQRLGARGATVVLIATEPPGVAVGNGRCTQDECPWWLRFQLDHYGDITTRWNSILRRFAEGHPDRMRFVSVTDVICATDVAPCDDRIDGVPARPDGTHYKRGGEELVIDTLLRMLAPVMDPISRSSA
jgi:peptidoglycan/LPS O-acetylase OafA/YrhL